ncbi:MAG: hypothetical protein RL735_1418, partial [Pseudomonadota bacterium]
GMNQGLRIEPPGAGHNPNRKSLFNPAAAGEQI